MKRRTWTATGHSAFLGYVVFEEQSRPRPIEHDYSIWGVISRLNGRFYDNLIALGKELQEEGTCHLGSGKQIQKVHIVQAEMIRTYRMTIGFVRKGNNLHVFQALSLRLLMVYSTCLNT